MKQQEPDVTFINEGNMAQEPVAKHICNLWVDPQTLEYEVDRCTHPISEVIPVYTAPPRKPWVGLTNKEVNEIWQNNETDWESIKRVEAKLKELNT